MLLVLRRKVPDVVPAVREGDVENLAGPGVAALTSATGDEPVVPAGEPVTTVSESVLPRLAHLQRDGSSTDRTPTPLLDPIRVFPTRKTRGSSRILRSVTAWRS